MPVLSPLHNVINKEEIRTPSLYYSYYSGAYRLWSTAVAYRNPRDLADRMSRRRGAPEDGYVRETFTLPREEAWAQARLWLDRWPAAAYMSAVDSWRELPDGEIEFTMKRLRSAD